jgi:hypothetical protein
MLGVPDQELFNQTMLDRILNRTSYLELPSAVHLALTNSSKRRNKSTTNTTNNNSRQTRQRTGIVRVNHDNQPNEIKISSDEYRSKVTPFLQTNKNKVPRFDDTTDECLKFAYLGYCNTDCPRAKAYTTTIHETPGITNYPSETMEMKTRPASFDSIKETAAGR